jgi:cytochrome bd-type quinol oxidase subunit 1
MGTTALLLPRLQFAFTVSSHIIYPSFTIGLAAWLTVLEALQALRLSGQFLLVSQYYRKTGAMILVAGASPPMRRHSPRPARESTITRPK